MKKTQLVLFVLFTLVSGIGCSKKVPNTAQGVVEKSVEAMKKNDIGTVYAMLPESYKNDVQSLVDEYAATIDAKTYDNAFMALHSIINGTNTNTDKVHKSISRMLPKLSKEEFQKSVADLTTLWAAIEGSNLNKHSGIKSMKVESFLNKHGAAILDAFDNYSKASGDKTTAEKLADAKVETVKTEGDITTLKITSNGTTDEITFKKVEGRWVPADLADSWEMQMKSMKQNLETFKKEYAGNKEQYRKMSAEALKAAQQFEKDGNVQSLFQLMSGF